MMGLGVTFTYESGAGPFGILAYLVVASRRRRSPRMSICACKFFDCERSGLKGEVIEARECGETFTPAEVGDLFSSGRIRDIDGDGVPAAIPDEAIDAPVDVGWCRARVRFEGSSGFTSLWDCGPCAGPRCC